MVKKKAYFYGTGRRKTAVARVRLMPGEGAIVINGIACEELFPRPEHHRRVRLMPGEGAIVINGIACEELFPRPEHHRTIVEPLLVTESIGKYSVVAKVAGGGISGQSGAISHGIARALVVADEKFKPVLRQCTAPVRTAYP
jgi:small subunit ribosomal protein S9